MESVRTVLNRTFHVAIFKQQTEIPRVLNGLGTAVLSTSKGVVSDREARKLKVGGEVLCYIW